ncbi:unnamed protein product [Rhizoctonia solani]|uniref:Uncharacterized protein n=1 Tax=Rhizoctonia solani TaxID=456999 RepID=A0A8H3DD13_9AGAM|nr:unnamed protein product [Rhizoctonia solani]CAE6521593.1 unnamed protein product [Rhizoctonia solani]
MALSPEVLFHLRVADFANLLVLLLTLLLKHPNEPQTPSDRNPEITSVARAVDVLRKQLIVLLLGLSVLTAFLEGSVTVASAIFRNVFGPTLLGWKGIGFYSITLLVTIAGQAVYFCHARVRCPTPGVGSPRRTNLEETTRPGKNGFLTTHAT